MEERKTIFDYMAQVLIVFGFSMLTINIFCLLLGDSAKEFSAMFALGRQGIPTATVFQFLCVSVLMTGVRFLFFTDIFIKKMPIWCRTACMLTAVVIIITCFVIAFDWFPTDMWQPWIMFFICFGISFAGSYFVMLIKEKTENKRMEEALRRLKAKEEKTNESRNYD